MKKIEKALDLLEQYHENYWDDFYEMSEENYARKTANKNAIDKAKAELAELRENLRGIEWVDDTDTHKYCPACDRIKVAGHAPDCWLAKMIGGE